MTKKHERSGLAATFAALAAAALLSACWDDDGDNEPDTPPATSEVPASASDTADGFIDYLQRLVASSADTLEPVDTSAVTPPVDDTGEPRQVD